MFASSRSDDPQARVSFEEYIAKMPEDQNADLLPGRRRFRFDRQEPNLEIFRRRGIEVIFMTDPVDEFALNVAGELSARRSSRRSIRPISRFPKRSSSGEKEAESTGSSREGKRLPQGP